MNKSSCHLLSFFLNTTIFFFKHQLTNITLNIGFESKKNLIDVLPCFAWIPDEISKFEIQKAIPQF